MKREKPPPVAIIDLFYGEDESDGEYLTTYIADTMPETQSIIISDESDLQKTLSDQESVDG
ncbi:MAG: hypothetical protein JW863_14510 [Chitinispirillaceae bacterium]|nr:hypothetical protein [Chitinispirillaceae bacterium]